MIPVLLEGPIIEPVSLLDAKLWLRIENNEEDELFRALIVAARLLVEAEIGQVLIAQNWRLVGDYWPKSEIIPVKVGKIINIIGGRIFSKDGTPIEITASKFSLASNEKVAGIVAEERPEPGRLRGGIEVDLRIGFGESPSDIPETIRLAIKRLVVLWYEKRGDAVDFETGMPPQIRTLLRPFRRVRL